MRFKEKHFTLTSDPWISRTLQANHVAEEVEFQQVKEGMHTEDWAAAQCATTQDYGHGSWPVFLLTGGLNYQVRLVELHVLSDVKRVATLCA